MSLCCKTCDHRDAAVKAFPAAPAQLDVCLVVLSFKAAISTDTKPYYALSTVLNRIVDSDESTSHPTTFTSWSPCLTDPHKVIVISTARETCSNASSPIFEELLTYLVGPPLVLHVYLDYSVLSLAASDPDQRIACDIITLQTPNPSVAVAVGKHFGWNPSRSSLMKQISAGASAAFNRPGDLIKDFWAWAELQHEDPMSPGSSFASSHESLPRPAPLRSWNSDEKNMALAFPDEDDEENEENEAREWDDETLVMIFQWNSHADAERFKHPSQTSYGHDCDKISNDLWDRQVAHPVRQMQGLGAKANTYKLELRAVEPWPEMRRHGREETGRKRSGSKRLSLMASELTGRMSGFWR